MGDLTLSFRIGENLLGVYVLPRGSCLLNDGLRERRRAGGGERLRGGRLGYARLAEGAHVSATNRGERLRGGDLGR